MRIAALLLLFLLAAGKGPAPAGVRPQKPTTALRPQYVAVSFDGSGGAEMFEYWRAVARRVHARFTFFVSGVYLLDRAHSLRYHAPLHARGRSDIGFAPDRAYADATRAEAEAAYNEGHEIGTHFNGHFCAPYDGNVEQWNASDWSDELGQFETFMFSGRRMPFGEDEVVGTRTPCLQGNMHALYPVLARRGFRYDASQVALLGVRPWRQGGIWSVPLLELPFVGHTFRVVSMDYNFFANQVGESPSRIERETYLTLRAAFRRSYRGNRAPLSIGFHFETWEDGAYDRALARFLGETCRLPAVRCTSIRELVDWLDLRFPRLAGYPH
jgi:peptidoglycan/xylan/chitin deacetylase (PgdA/CDA1 family)